MEMQAFTLPCWLLKLARRILHLAPGRYQIVLTISAQPDWTVIRLGSIENE
jgi:hypothetical protein